MSFVVEDRSGADPHPPRRSAIGMPNWKLALPESVRRVRTAYFGVQRHSPADASSRAAAEASAAIRRVLEGTDASTPESFEVVAGHDMPGARVQVACWHDLDAASRCLADLDLTALHASLGDWRDSVGLWCEEFTTDVSRLETHYVGPDPLRHRPGLAGLPHALAVMTDAVDRPAHAHPWRSIVGGDPFATPPRPELPGVVPFGYGERLSGSNLHGIVHVRCGHEGFDCGEVETGLLDRGLQILIDLGLDHLWSHPAETGTYGLRQLVRVDAEDRHLADTGFAGFMRNAIDLARWNDEHAAHLRDFQRLLDQEGISVPQRRLRSYREVSVLDPGDARFDYVNCGPRTGVIRYVELDRVRLRVRHDLG